MLVHNYFIARKYCVRSRYVANNYINVSPANTFFNDAYQTISDIQFIATGRVAPVTGYKYIYHAKSRLNTPVWGSLPSPNYIPPLLTLNNVVITTVIEMVEMIEILGGRLGKRSVEYVINNLLHLVIVKYGDIYTRTLYFHSPAARDNTVATREISRHISRLIHLLP